MNNIFMAVIVAFVLWAGWYPTESNIVDFVSMLCFVVGCANAYVLGLTSK